MLFTEATHILHEKEANRLKGNYPLTKCQTLFNPSFFLTEAKKLEQQQEEKPQQKRKNIVRSFESGSTSGKIILIALLFRVHTLFWNTFCISFIKRLTFSTHFALSRRQLIDFFRVYFFTSQSLTLAVAIAAKPKLISHDKENISANNNNRAIVAVSLIQKPPQAKKPSILKNVLKKTLPVASAASTLAQGIKKGGPEKEIKSAAVKSDTTIVKKPPTMMSSIGKRQFDYAEVQKKRKEQLVQKLKEQEEKQLKFTFHANPAPKFKKVQVASKQSSVDLTKRKPLTKQHSLPFIHLNKTTTKENIVPSCGDPERLKYLDEKKKMLLAKYQEAQFQFKAKPAAVLKKQPFQPVHNIKVVDPKPFKLQLTERLLQRSEFDKKLHETIAIRKKQEEFRKRHEEFENRKIIRQKTEFKARANPFRNY